MQEPPDLNERLAGIEEKMAACEDVAQLRAAVERPAGDAALAPRRGLRGGDCDRFPGPGAGIRAIIGGPSAPRAPDPA